MIKKVAVLSTTLMLGLGSMVAIPNVKAESIKSKRASIQAGISTANAAITQAQAELAKLDEQIKRADQAIIDNQNMIVTTEKKIVDTKSEVSDLQVQINNLKERIAKRNEVLKKRALTFQETGGNVSYIDVLFGASSFSNLIERIGAVTTMVEADQDLLKKHEEDKQEVEKKQTIVINKLSELTEMKTELLGMQAQIAEQKAQNDELKEQLKTIEKNGLSEKANLESQDRNLALKEYELKRGVDGGQKTKTYSMFNAPATVSGNGDINDVIRAGYKYIGNSVYVFGGGRTESDIANGRFDCSGFVHWAFAQAGVQVGSSTDSLKYAGTQVSSSDLQPGDLVFFNTYKKDGHVGIYIGGGQFIGSQSSTGVAIANMTSGYWKERFNGRVVRVL